MRIVLAALAIVLLVAPAQAQRMKGKRGAAGGQQTEEQKKKSAEVEKAYKASLDTIPDPKTKPDPWRNVR